MPHLLISIGSAISATGAMPLPDPLPLPAPVWLLKSLHDLTLGLHFGALHMLLGGLVLALVWNILGHVRGNRQAQGASRLVVRKLPIITTYVINLGVPPLLFAQVMYGQALYTSSVLMASWWFSAVFLIMGAYAILYRMAYLAEKGKPFWHWNLVAVPVFIFVGRLFSGNMTLMLRPESWNAIYTANPHGTSLPSDPTTWPRVALVLLSSLALGALCTSLWSLLDAAKPFAGFLRRQAGLVAAAVLPAVMLAGLWAMGSQPVAVQSAVLGSGLGQILSYTWCAAVALAFVLALALVWKPVTPLVYLTALPALVAVGAFTVVRDLVRDATLVTKGFDVWKSAEHTNWPLVWIFLASLVLGLAFTAWLGTVVAGSRSESLDTAPEGAHV